MGRRFLNGLNADDLTAGTTALARGGTGQDLSSVSGKNGQVTTLLAGAVSWAWDAWLQALCSNAIDGNATISGTTTITRDMHYDTLTIGTAGVLRVNGYRVFAKKIVIQGAGKLSADGRPAGTPSGQAAAWAQYDYPNNYAYPAAAGTIQAIGYSQIGGANNGPTPANGPAGVSCGTYARGAGGTGGASGAGGDAAATYTGGIGGSAGVITSSIQFPYFTTEFQHSWGQIIGGTRGSRGGGGGGDNVYSGGTSAAVSDGAGVLAFYTLELDISNPAQAGAITAQSGDFNTATGGHLAGGTAGSGGAGGNGGGGGGYIYGVIGKITGSAVTNLVNADGRAGSAGGDGGASAKGGQGGAGGNGGNIDIFLGSNQTWYSVRGSAGGAVGSVPSNATGSAGGAAGTCRLTL